MLRTGKLPTGGVLNFVPGQYMAAFAVWHFSGMFGTSEAHAESVGSLPKRYAKSFSTSRVLESTMLRSHGLAGRGGGTEDAVLDVCWRDFFGGLDAERFSLHFRNSKKRQTRYPYGAGSKTLQRYVEQTVGGPVWTQRDILKVGSPDRGHSNTAKSLAWVKRLASARTTEAGLAVVGSA